MWQQDTQQGGATEADFTTEGETSPPRRERSFPASRSVSLLPSHLLLLSLLPQTHRHTVQTHPRRDTRGRTRLCCRQLFQYTTDSSRARPPIRTPRERPSSPQLSALLSVPQFHDELMP